LAAASSLFFLFQPSAFANAGRSTASGSGVSTASEGGGDEVLKRLASLAAGADVEIVIVGRPSLLPEIRDAATAMEFLLGEDFDRVEVYGPDGRLQRLVAVAREPEGDLTIGESPIPARPMSLVGRDDRGQTAAARTLRAARPENDRSLAESIAIARDPSASRSERERALFELARSGSNSAVEALRDLIDEEDGELRGEALAALGAFADTPAAEAAQQALRELPETLCSQNPVACAEGQAPYEVAPLIAMFEGLDNTLDAKAFVRAVTRNGEGPGLTEFLLVALGNNSVTIRNVTVLELMRLGDRVDGPLVTAALQNTRSNDPWPRMRSAADLALRVRAESSTRGGRGGRGDSNPVVLPQ
jgi:hypothetical protein